MARSYARAVFEVAKERGQVELVGRELSGLADMLTASPALGEFLSRPWIGIAAKREAARDVARRAGLGSLTADFFELVVTHGRGDHLGLIADAFRNLADAAAGRVRARVRTAVPLTGDERTALAGRLGRELGGQQVILQQEVDAGLTAGFVAEVGSYVLDASLDGQLARLRARLVSAEVPAAQRRSE